MDSMSFVFELPPTSHAQGEIIRDGYKLIVDVLREPLHELHCAADITPQYFVIFDVFPFAAGAQRLAFKGSIYERKAQGDPIFCAHAVVKMEMAIPAAVELMESERTRLNAVETLKTIRKHDITKEYVEKWCNLGINKSVYVLSTETLTVTRGCSLQDIDKRRFPILHQLFKKLSLDAVLYQHAVGTVEDYIPGRFTKFLNNDGIMNIGVSANFPAAFSHWSWVESKGKLMVSDIQGVRTGAGYVLTDPCIHSIDDPEGFGIPDLGMVGVQEFFKNHQCNALCTDLGLGKDDADIDLGHALRTRLLPKTRPAASERHLQSAHGDKNMERNAPCRFNEAQTGMKTGTGRRNEDLTESQDDDESAAKAARRSTMRLRTRCKAAYVESSEERRKTITAGEKKSVEGRERGRAWHGFRGKSVRRSEKEEAKRSVFRALFARRKKGA